MDEAWKRRSAAREALERAYQEKQSAYGVQDAAWHDYQSVRSSNGPRIDSLNSQQENAFQRMKDAFNSASNAYEARDGASARMYADEGHRYKAESQGYVAERRQLVQQIRDARERHNATRPAFQRAKDNFDQAKRRHDQAKEDHQRKQAEFKRAKADFDQTAAAFRSRLEEVQAESKRRKDDRRSIAERAGVPYEYLDNVWISEKPDGTINIYFGGVDRPDGIGHGHYVMDPGGSVTYRRDPFDPHGAHNFTDSQHDYYDVVTVEADSEGAFAFWCNFRGYAAYVESNVNHEGRDKIDIYYGPNGPLGHGHHHAVAYRETPHDFIYDELRD